MPPGSKPSTEQASLKPPSFLKESSPGYPSSSSSGRMTPQLEKLRPHPLKPPAKPAMSRLANALDLAKRPESKFEVSKTVNALDLAEVYEKEPLDLAEIYKEPKESKKPQLPPQPKKSILKPQRSPSPATDLVPPSRKSTKSSLTVEALDLAMPPPLPKSKKKLRFATTGPDREVSEVYKKEGKTRLRRRRHIGS